MGGPARASRQNENLQAVLVQNVIKDVDSYEMLVARFQGQPISEGPCGAEGQGVVFLF